MLVAGLPWKTAHTCKDVRTGNQSFTGQVTAMFVPIPCSRAHPAHPAHLARLAHPAHPAPLARLAHPARPAHPGPRALLHGESSAHWDWAACMHLYGASAHARLQARHRTAAGRPQDGNGLEQCPIALIEAQLTRLPPLPPPTPSLHLHHVLMALSHAFGLFVFLGVPDAPRLPIAAGCGRVLLLTAPPFTALPPPTAPSLPRYLRPTSPPTPAAPPSPRPPTMAPLSPPTPLCAD